MKQFCKRGHDTFICGRTKDRLCKECGRFLSRQWAKNHKEQRTSNHYKYIKERRKKLNEIKDKPCMDCHKKYPPYVMQFDHVSGKKVRDIAAWTTYSFDALMDEIKKCELVCANCHAVRTHQRNQSRIKLYQKEK